MHGGISFVCSRESPRELNYTHVSNVLTFSKMSYVFYLSCDIPYNYHKIMPSLFCPMSNCHTS